MIKHYLVPVSLCLLLNGMNSISSFGQCDFRRADIATFTGAKQSQLCSLIMAYLTEGVNTSTANSPDDYPIVGHHSEHFGTIHFTGTAVFLTWHRAYLQELENWLIDRGFSEFVPLPYWNPFDEVPDAFFNDADGDGINAVLPVQDGFDPLVNQNPSQINGPIDYDDLIPFTTNAICDYPNLTSFSTDFEGPHGAPHVNISGTMEAGHSPGAAIFWLWHAWVDEIYYCYQKECMGLESDVWMKDDANDDGTEPNPVDIFYLSPDIFSADGWIDGGGGLNIQQNNGEAVTIAVRVRNRGAMPNENGVGEIKLYWAHASTGLGWPAPFDGSDLLNCPDPEPAGGFIGSQQLRSVNNTYVDVFDADGDGNTTETQEDYTIYYFEWMPPDPDNYVGCFGDDWQHRHFCIMARIEEPGGMTFPENGNYWENIRNNNNIVLRNIALWGNGIPGGITPPGPPEDCILVGNYTPVTMDNVRFEITFPETSDAAMLNNVELRIKFSPELHGKWEIGGEMGTGVAEEVINGEKWVRFQQENARIEGFSFAPYEIAEGCVSIVPINPNNTEGFYNFDVRQYSGSTMIGGERFEVDLSKLIGERSSDGISDDLSEDSNDFSIRPNPAQDYFTVSSLEFGENNTLEVYNEIGQLVHSGEFRGTSHDVKAKGFGKGIFIVKVKNKVSGKEFTQKLVLQ